MVFVIVLPMLTPQLLLTSLKTCLNNCKEKSVQFILNNISTNNPEIICNAFNDYFIDIGTQLANKITGSTNPLKYLNSIQSSIFIPPILEQEVSEVIHSLNHSSPGWDELPAHIFKTCMHKYIKPLTYIINKSICDGIFPDKLKIANIIPIFKSGDKSSVSNYRPISVLTLFSKIFEKIMYNHLTNFINAHNILYKFQFGFRKQYSTNHAIISLVERIRSSLSSGKIMIGVFLDLKKAFDTVNHDILLKKLYSYGIRGNIHNWFKSYLTNRKQFVSMYDMKSETKSISCGIPQGSVLGPLLFILYINDISAASDILIPVLFADDTSVFIDGNTPTETMNTLNLELKKITIWLSANKLTLNIVKSHYMIFHRARLKHHDNCQVLLGDSALEHVRFTKFLGMIIDEKLNFTNHIAYISNTISKGLGIIYKARKYLNKNVLVNLYNSYVFPYLTYCVEIWGNACDSHLDPLIKLQQKNYSHHYFFSI